MQEVTRRSRLWWDGLMMFVGVASNAHSIWPGHCLRRAGTIYLESGLPVSTTSTAGRAFCIFTDSRAAVTRIAQENGLRKPSISPKELAAGRNCARRVEEPVRR